MEKTEIKEKFTKFLDEWKALFSAINPTKEEKPEDKPVVETKEDPKAETTEVDEVAEFKKVAEEIKTSITAVTEKFTAYDEKFTAIESELKTAKETISTQDELLKKTFALVEKCMEMPQEHSTQKKKDGVKVETEFKFDQASIDEWKKKYLTN